jgi:hypothetical protein
MTTFPQAVSPETVSTDPRWVYSGGGFVVWRRRRSPAGRPAPSNSDRTQKTGGIMYKKTNPSFRLAALLALAGLCAAPVRAAELELSKAVQKVKISGDLRLRQENFFKKTKGQTDRGRQRFRLRLGTDLSFPRSVTAKIRLASGTGEQVSTNQSLDNLSSQKQLWIDRAYLEWKACDAASFTGGRMANPLWTVYSSDVVWDDDFNPEGFGEQFKFSLFGRGRFFVNALQMVADEDSGTNNDQSLFSGQAGVEIPLFSESRLKLAGAMHEWVNETTTTRRNAGTLSQAAVQEGNRRYASGVLQNEFRVAELTAEYKSKLLGLPVALQGTYVRNVNPVDAISPKETSGYQAGAVLGKASAAKSWEAAYFHKSVETDATVADVADSDFGDGGTNRRGHIMWLAYNPEEWIQFKTKYFITQVAETKLSPGADDINRLQVDLSVKF